jgi:hypothetical protein
MKSIRGSAEVVLAGAKAIGCQSQSNAASSSNVASRVPPLHSASPTVPFRPELSLPRLFNFGGSSLLEKIRCCHVSVGTIRHFTRGVLDPNKLGSVSLLEIKKFLRQKMLEFEESHSCLAVTIPKHILDKNSTGPPEQWKKLDVALAKVYINKITGGFVCPDLALAGEWKALEDFLLVWHKNKMLKKGEAQEPYPELESFKFETPEEVSKMWQSCQPIESLTVKEFKEVLKLFKLPVVQLKPEDFVKYEVRVNKAQDKLIFPVRYIHGPSIVGLRIVSICPDTGQTTEDNVPSDWSHTSSRIFPFPHGLDMATKFGAKSVLLVTSVLDSVCISAKSNFVPIALAEGANSLPPDHLPFFESFEKISLW